MNESQMTHVRQARQCDVAAVRRLIHRTIDVCYAGVYPPRAIGFFKDFHSQSKIMQRSRDGDVLVLEHNGEIIGTGALLDGAILGVFVHPQFQRQGHGKALMRELETRAKLRGFEEVVLGVSLPSRAFYKGLGYEIIGDWSIEVGEGQHLHLWRARKMLTEGKSQQCLLAHAEDCAAPADSLRRGRGR